MPGSFEAELQDGYRCTAQAIRGVRNRRVRKDNEIKTYNDAEEGAYPRFPAYEQLDRPAAIGSAIVLYMDAQN